MLYNERMWGKLQVLVQSFKKKIFDQKGAVLIEFAFCCPILIILLFFVLDVPLAYRMLLKMQKIPELTANMIRNIPNKTDTLITLNDLKNISRATGITMTGKLGSPSDPCNRYPFYLSTYIFCVVGNSSGGFDKKWNVHIKNNLYDGTIIANPNDTTEYSKFQTANKFEDIKEFENFQIQDGEVKLIIETVAWYRESNTIEGASGISSGSGSSSLSEDGILPSGGRGFNNNFHLMTIPGRTVSIAGKESENIYFISTGGAKAFGNRYSIMSCVDDIVDSEEYPE